MKAEYTHYEMFQSLEQYFVANYSIEENMIRAFNDPVGDVRVPLYYLKKTEYGTELEIAIDIITAREVSEEKIFPSIRSKPPDKTIIFDASPVLFYQYYLPTAKIFLAYPDYLKKNVEYDKIVNICKKRGIGLLEVGANDAVPILTPKSLLEMFWEEIKTKKSRSNPTPKIIGKYLEDSIIRLVYYPDPIYKRRAIIGRLPWQISFTLVDKVENLQRVNIVYKRELNKFSNQYRIENRDDFEIANSYIATLWKKRLSMKYPVVHMHMEEILQRRARYREHFVHQFQVFLLGIYILDKLYANEKVEKIKDSFKKKYNCELEDAWLAAATFHDFNYGLQDFDTWLLDYLKETLFMTDVVAKQSVNILNLDAAMMREYLYEKLKEITKIIKKTKNKEKEIIKYFYEKCVRDKNHGILSALSLMKLWDKYSSKNLLKKEAILQSAFAIAIHDEEMWEAMSGCKGYVEHENDNCLTRKCKRRIYDKRKKAEIYKYNELTNRKGCPNCEQWEQVFMNQKLIPNILFRNHPLLFLLILCDSIQDEGRKEMIINEGKNKTKRPEGDIYIKIRKDDIFDQWIQSKDIIAKTIEKKEIKKLFSEAIRVQQNKQINHPILLSDNARAYNNIKSYAKWKIVDKNAIYIIEQPKRGRYKITEYEKESRLADIAIDSETKEVIIKINVDGINEKVEELQRIAWVLKDNNFKIVIQEDQTTVEKNIIFNGKGG